MEHSGVCRPTQKPFRTAVKPYWHSGNVPQLQGLAAAKEAFRVHMRFCTVAAIGDHVPFRVLAGNVEGSRTRVLLPQSRQGYRRTPGHCTCTTRHRSALLAKAGREHLHSAQTVKRHCKDFLELPHATETAATECAIGNKNI